MSDRLAFTAISDDDSRRELTQRTDDEPISASIDGLRAMVLSMRGSMMVALFAIEALTEAVELQNRALALIGRPDGLIGG